MPELDKQEYKKRREAGLRGQGDKEKPVVTPGKMPVHRLGLTPVNRATARKKVTDPKFTKKYPTRQKTLAELKATHERVNRKELGEKARVGARSNA